MQYSRISQWPKPVSGYNAVEESVNIANTYFQKRQSLVRPDGVHSKQTNQGIYRPEQPEKVLRRSLVSPQACRIKVIRPVVLKINIIPVDALYIPQQQPGGQSHVQGRERFGRPALSDGHVQGQG